MNPSTDNQQRKALNANAPIFTPSKSHNAKKYEVKSDPIVEEPLSVYDALPNRIIGIVTVPRQLTKTIIPNTISENIHDVYHFMDKSMAFPNNKQAFSGHAIIVINFNFHSTGSKEILLCVITEEKGFVGRRWRMLNKLFTVKMIKQKYGISADKLPMAFHAKHCVDIVRERLQSRQIVETIINNTKWNKIKIHHKTNNKRRRILCMIKNEFIVEITKQISNFKRVLPILAFYDKSYRTEYVWIIDLTQQLSIGISFKLEPLMVTGIYLDKDEILRYHQLISPQHECQCLNGFVSDFEDLKIGNVHNDENQIKALKKENRKLKQMIKTLQSLQEIAFDVHS